MLTTLRTRPEPVAVARVFLAVGAGLISLEGAAHVHALQGGRITVPVADWLPTADSLPLVAWFVVMTFAAGGLLAGVLANASAGVLSLGHALLLALDQQLYSNHRLLLVLLCAAFVLAASDRAYAPGARGRRDRAGATVPWWPHLVVVAAVSSCYLFAGLSKLNPEFLTGDLVAVLAPAWVPAQLAAWATPLTEIAIALGLWWPRARLAAIVLGIGLHLSIVVLLGAPLVFGAFALLCMTAYPLAGRRPAVRAPVLQ